MTDLTKCPNCGGEADNGIDRCYPPTAYNCTKCEKNVEMIKMTKTLEYKFGSPDFPDRFEKYSDGSIVDTEKEMTHDNKTRAALDALSHYLDCTSHQAFNDNQEIIWKEAWNALETINTTFTEAAELKAQNTELLDDNPKKIFNAIKECLKEIRPEMDICELLAMATTLTGAIARAEKGQ